MCAKTPSELPSIAKKYEKCIKTIPKLEKFIREVCEIVVPHSSSDEALTYMKDVIPILQK